MDIFGLTASDRPLCTYAAATLGDVPGLLDRAEAAALDGRWVVLLLPYDAAPAFEPAMRVQSDPAATLPLAWAAEFGDMREASFTTAAQMDRWPTWLPSISRDEFCDTVRAVQRHIVDGDTRQVNLTFRLFADAPRDAKAWYAGLRATQPAAYAAYLELGNIVVLSLSSELFFEVEGNRIRTRPMKGTMPRGRWLAEDDAMERMLQESTKARAENVMIVDVLRSDLGRVAVPASVHVPHCFTVERYPTLWQMSSTVEGELRNGTRLNDVFKALFPCGSATGAPKLRTMEIITQVESAPRGLYTGTIGLLRPGGDATFSLASRTIVIDGQARVATLGVGADITADSVAEDEYEECLLKGAFASGASRLVAESFELLETMRLENGTIVRLERHLRRCAASARYFGFVWDDARAREALSAAAASHSSGVWRLRLTVNRDGRPVLSCTVHQDAAVRTWHVAFANVPVDEQNPFLCNKTTNRREYDTARRGRPDVDDVLLWNRRGELTESTIANVVVEIDGVRYTPPITCGLLAGTLREELLESGSIRERVITRGEVVRAPRIWLINSMRGWLDAQLVR